LLRVEQAAPYDRAPALEKLGQTDRAKTIYEQLIDTALNILHSVPATGTSAQSAAALAQRTQLSDAHFILGLGQLGLNNRD
jgi:hypothetical protein